jgi:hypothetical protein
MKMLRSISVALCIVLIAVIGTIAAPNAPVSLVGTWAGKDDTGVYGAFIFRADGTADVIRGAVSMKDTMVKDDGSITYHLDSSVTPIALDLILMKKNGPAIPIRCIAEFISANKMRVRMPNGLARPTDFEGPKNEMIVVQKLFEKKP